MFQSMNSIIFSGICIEANLVLQKDFSLFFSLTQDHVQCNKKKDNQNSSHSALNLVSRLWLDRKLMWREMAQRQTFTINSVMYGRAIGAFSKNWAPHKQFLVLPDCAPIRCSLFTPRCLHPLPLADNNGAGLCFLHSFPFLPLQLWPGRSFHNSTCVATQKVRLSPKFVLYS